MTRIIVGVGLALLLIVGATPWVLGIQIEEQFRTYLQTLNQREFLGVYIEDYRRGWFESDALLSVELTDADIIQDLTGLGHYRAQYGLTLPVHVAHGPLPVMARDPHVSFIPAFAAIEGRVKLPIHNDEETSLSLNAQIFLDGSVSAKAALAPLILGYEGARQVKWNGISARYRYAPADKVFKARVDAGGVSVIERGRQILVSSPIRVKTNLKRSPSGLWLGNWRLDIARVEAYLPRDPNYLDRINGFHFESESEQTDGVVKYSALVELSSMLVSTIEYGPLHLELSASNLDAAALARLQNVFMALSQQFTDQETLGAAFAAAILAELPQLASHEPRLELEALRLMTPEGLVSMSGYLTVPTRDHTVLNNPFLFSRAIEGKLGIRVPRAFLLRLMTTLEVMREVRPRFFYADPLLARCYILLTFTHSSTSDWAERARQRLRRYERNGLLKADGDAYRLEIAYNNGLLIINGIPWRAISYVLMPR